MLWVIRFFVISYSMHFMHGVPNERSKYWENNACDRKHNIGIVSIAINECFNQVNRLICTKDNFNGFWHTSSLKRNWFETLSKLMNHNLSFFHKIYRAHNFKCKFLKGLWKNMNILLIPKSQLMFGKNQKDIRPGSFKAALSL